MEPSVAFLKPIGMDRPDANCRCTWLSVLRAPIAPQLIASEIYCGLVGSKNSVAAAKPSSSTPSSVRRANSKPFLILQLPSISGSLIRPFQPTVVRGFSKYTRMTISSSPSNSPFNADRRRA